MFKGHPKGLYVLFFSNMGERFGYYTMLAIFTLYLRDHFGWTEAFASNIYGLFLAGIYFMPLFGGIIADNALGYGKTIVIGLVVMILGYLFLAIPTSNPYLMYSALAVICFGVGMFKGNLAVLVGNLYDNASGSLKDAAFNIYYMGINIGAFFAPHAAAGIKNMILGNAGFTYDPEMPQLAQKYLSNGTIDNALSNFFHTANPAQLTELCHKYLDTLAVGYNAGFAIASVAMIISLIVFIIFKKHYIQADYTSRDKSKATKDVELTPKQEKDRIFALLAIFGIVVFFWMAFHQNGAALTFFAKNYTDLSVGKLTYILFNIPALIAIFAIVLGLIATLGKNTLQKYKIIGGIAAVAGAAYLIYFYNTVDASNNVTPELFQSFNPIFIVFMTPIVVGFFSWLNKRNSEPTAPAKIGIGMAITGLAFFVMLMASMGQPPVYSLAGKVSPSLVSPYFLISTYFVLTIAELFLSPMGLSFVSKVSPPRMKGLMQGGWLAATAIGNYLAGFIGEFYQNWHLWQFFLLLIVTSLVSAILVSIILKTVNRAINS